MSAVVLFCLLAVVVIVPVAYHLNASTNEVTSSVSATTATTATTTSTTITTSKFYRQLML